MVCVLKTTSEKSPWAATLLVSAFPVRLLHNFVANLSLFSVIRFNSEHVESYKPVFYPT